MALAVTARGQEVGTLTARILSKWALNGHIFSHCKCNCSDLHFVTRDLPPHRCCGNTAQPQLGCRSMDATALPAAPPCSTSGSTAVLIPWCHLLTASCFLTLNIAPFRTARTAQLAENRLRKKQLQSCAGFWRKIFGLFHGSFTCVLEENRVISFPL